MDKLKIGETDLDAIVTKVNEIIELYNRNIEAEIKRLATENKTLSFKANLTMKGY